MKKLLLLLSCFFSFTSCTTSHVNQHDLFLAYSKVVKSDGINEREMMAIAQYFLLTTSDIKCQSKAADLNLSKPFIRCGWIEPGVDQGCYVGFSTKRLLPTLPFYIKVSEKTGRASCVGQLVLK